MKISTISPSLILFLSHLYARKRVILIKLRTKQKEKEKDSSKEIFRACASHVSWQRSLR